jgi:hypothetical protein
MRNVVWVILFAIAFAWVEASVVVYLRDIYYPDGFAFPLKVIDDARIGIELVREFATLVMLGAIGMLAGRTRWQRLAHFAIAFGVWDIFFYVWLKVMIDWPATILDWDILFLLPIPWIGPVIAPVLISVILIGGGLLILKIETTKNFHPSRAGWILSVAGSSIVLWTFMRDMEAGLHEAIPEPFAYALFGTGCLCYLGAMYVSYRASMIASESAPS